MGYVVPDGFARVQINFIQRALGGSTPTFGFGVNVNPSTELLDTIEGWVNDNLLDFLATGWQLDTIVAYNDELLFDRIIGLSGHEEADMMPPAVAALIKLTSDNRGRANRGRIYVPGVLRESDVDDAGNIGGTKLADLVDLFGALGVALIGIDATFYILHSSADLDPTLVTSAGPEPLVATQRRRQRA